MSQSHTNHICLQILKMVVRKSREQSCILPLSQHVASVTSQDSGTFAVTWCRLLGDLRWLSSSLRLWLRTLRQNPLGEFIEFASPQREAIDLRQQSRPFINCVCAWWRNAFSHCNNVPVSLTTRNHHHQHHHVWAGRPSTQVSSAQI